MPIEFIGSLVNGSAANFRSGGYDSGYPARMARLHEEAGFDRLLVGHSSSSPDGSTVADTVLNATTRLGVLLAHRPGFVAPTVAARQYATLDAFHPGRVAMHIISGGDDADQARDGDFSDKAARYRRSDEFLDIVKREWESTTPFDYEGEFYQVKGARSDVRPKGGALPVYFAGASQDAVRVAAEQAGRTIDRFSVSTRPIAAATEEAAWERAHRILDAELAKGGGAATFSSRGSLGSQRLADFADQSEIHDKRLWTPLAKTPTAGGNALIRGYDPEADAADYATIIDLVRQQDPTRVTVSA